jgi:hypothetical protein
MAIVKVEFDTISKDISVLLDGTPVDNVNRVEFIAWDKDENSKSGYVDIYTYEYIEDQKMSKQTHVMASEITHNEVKHVNDELVNAIAQQLNIKM